METQGLRSCIVKSNNNGRLFHSTIYWNDFPHQDFLDKCVDIPYIGYIQSLQADFINIDEVDPKILDGYDIIIFLSNRNENLDYIPNDKKIFIIPCEPEDSLVTKGNSDHFVLNNYSLDNKYENHIGLPYVYDLTTYSQYYKFPKENLIFKQKRSKDINLPNFKFLTENYSSRPYKDYFEHLSKCKYVYSTCDTLSPGQVIAEGCIVGAITFSTPQKLMAKLLLPEFCLVKDVSEIESKIIEIENDLTLYNNLLDQIQQNVKNYLSLSYFKNQIYEKIYSYNNNQ